MVIKTKETNENTTILLGLYYKQSIEIKYIHERLDTMGQRLGVMDQCLISVETKIDEHTQLLHEILKRLPT